MSLEERKETEQLNNEIQEDNIKVSPLISIEDKTDLVKPYKGPKRTFIPANAKIVLLSIALFLVEAMIVVGILTGLQEDELLPLISSGAFGVLLNVILIVSIVRVAKSKEKKYLLSLSNKQEVIDGLGCNNYKVDEIDEEEPEIELENVLYDDETIGTTTTTEVDFKSLCIQLRDHLGARGLKVDFNTIRTFVSALKSNRIILVKTDNQDDFSLFAKSISEFFGIDEFKITERQTYVNIEDLSCDISFDGIEVSEFTKGLIRANKLKNHMNVIFISNATCDNMMNYLHDVIIALSKPVEKKIKVNDHLINPMINDGYIKLPDNLWFIANISDSDKVPFDLVDVVTIFQLNCVKQDAKTEIEPKTDYVGYKQFMYEDQDDNDYFEEEQWKKIDKLVATINNVSEFTLGNKLTSQIEDFASVYIKSCEDKNEALDMAVATKIMPFAVRELPKSSYDSFVEEIDQIFGADNTTNIQKSFKKNVLIK